MLAEKQKITNDYDLYSKDSTYSNHIMYSRTDNPFGISWEDWTAKWWQWILSIPKDDNPGFDSSGERFYLTEKFRDQKVIFLVGTFGGSAERTYTIPKGKAILIPIINFTFCSIDENAELSEEELKLRAKKDIDDIVEKNAIFDGKRIHNIERYRVKSNVFDVIYPEKNVFELGAGPTRAVSDGYWIFLRPMDKSSHDLHISGSCSSGKTSVNINLHLNVV